MGGRAAVLRRAAGLLAASLLVVACSDEGNPEPRDTPAPQPPPPPSTEVILGVDESPAGFNPHTIADQYPLSPGIASLVLPSAFEQDPTGQWALDTDLLDTAEVTSTAPFTVTYRIRRDASWSDNAPIAAEDFSYLADRMRGQPGVADSAGYQLIDSIRAADGGKTVEVQFVRSFPQWRTLFRHLLPAHLLKDAPGGWDAALDEQIPVSGGPFRITRRDAVRGELILNRNDRYWSAPARLNRLIVRTGSTGDLVEGLGNGALQVAVFSRPDAVTMKLLTDAGLPAPIPVPEPVVATVLLRPVAPPLDDDRVRRAVAAALDRPALIATGAASGPSAGLVADAQTTAPSQEGYRPTAPPPRGADPAAVAALLTEAGYRRGLAGWERDGEALTIQVAAPGGQPAYQTIAARVVAQLQAVGIGAELSTPNPDNLLTDVASTTTHVVVYGQPVDVDAASTVASNQGCPIDTGGSKPPPNLSGGCDPAVQPVVEQALSGSLSADDLRAGVEPVLWARTIAIPLFQRTSLLVSTSAVDGVVAGALFEGALYTGARWRTAPR